MSKVHRKTLPPYTISKYIVGRVEERNPPNAIRAFGVDLDMIVTINRCRVSFLYPVNAIRAFIPLIWTYEIMEENK